MAEDPGSLLEEHARLNAEVVNETLRRGSRVAALLGGVSGTILLVLMTAGGQSGLLLPVLWAYFCSAYSIVVYLLSRAGRVKGAALVAVMLGFVSLPGTIYVAAWLVHPAGTATYITGPPSYLYFFLIAVSGLALDPRLALLCGGVAALQYALATAAGARHLAQLAAPDELLRADVSRPEFYYFKAFLMLFTGLVVSVIARNARRLLRRILAAEDEKRAISRLFGEYVSPEVRERILAEKSGTIGEKREVVVLFSDLRSFSTWSERADPEAVVLRLNEYFDRMVECITSEGGVVDKFIGDAVMGVFGGLVPLDNPSQAAFRAALRMRGELGRLNAGWAERGLEPLENGVGLHRGVVLQGTLGSRHRKEFTVIGDAVNTASRLEGLCKEQHHRILLSEAVHEQLDGESRARCAALGAVRVKGRSGEVRLYGADPAAGAGAAGAAGATGAAAGGNSPA